MTGNTSGVNLTFPEQSEQSVKLVFDNGDLVPVEVSLGGAAAPQEWLTVPSGPSTHEVTLSTGGSVVLNNADVLDTILNQGGGQTIIAQAPSGSGGSATVTTTGTVAGGGGGGSVTATVYTLPSGNTVTVNNGGLNTSPPAGPDVTGSPTGTGVITSTNSNLQDEAAREIAEIRAELSAIAALKNAEVDALGSASETDTTGILENVDGVKDATEGLLDGIGDGDFFSLMM